MAKNKRRWIELSYLNDGALRAEDIPYDNTSSIKVILDNKASLDTANTFSAGQTISYVSPAANTSFLTVYSTASSASNFNKRLLTINSQGSRFLYFGVDTYSESHISTSQGRLKFSVGETAHGQLQIETTGISVTGTLTTTGSIIHPNAIQQNSQFTGVRNVWTGAGTAFLDFDCSSASNGLNYRYGRGTTTTGDVHSLWYTPGTFGIVMSLNHKTGAFGVAGSFGLTGTMTVSGNSTFSGTQVLMGNGTRNTIHFSTAGVNPPSTNANGLKIKLYGSSADNSLAAGEYGIGIEGGNIWFVTGAGYKWYAGTSLSALAMNLNGNNLAVTGTVSCPSVDINANMNISSSSANNLTFQPKATNLLATRFVPKGDNRAIMQVFNSDYAADPANYQVVDFGYNSARTAAYINSYAGGTKAVLPFQIQVGSHVHFNADSVGALTLGSSTGAVTIPTSVQTSSIKITGTSDSGTLTMAAGTRFITTVPTNPIPAGVVILASYANEVGNNGGAITAYYVAPEIVIETTSICMSATPINWKVIR